MALAKGDKEGMKAWNEYGHLTGKSPEEVQGDIDNAGINLFKKSATQNYDSLLQSLKGNVSDGTFDKLQEIANSRTKTRQVALLMPE